MTLSFGSQPVLSGIDLTVAPGQKVGVVGPNGSGKSTLLRVLAGEIRPDSGGVAVGPATATVGLLPQEPDRRPDESVAGFVARRTGVADAATELDAATAALAEGGQGADVRYSEALERWLDLAGPDLEARTGVVLADLGLEGSVLDQPTASLSGGQAARVSLAATLLARFDIFLFDEPTNDLDFDGLERLEAFVTDLRSASVIVSHDRAFLDRVVTHVFDLDGHDHTGTLYAGGWQAYLADKATAHRHAVEAYGAYVSKRADMAARAQNQREWSSKGIGKAKRSGETDKFIRHRAKATSEKLASKARATERAAQRIEEVEKPWEGWELRFEIGHAERSGDDVASLRGAVVERGAFRLGPVDLHIGWADRVAITGPNGSGKTTLIEVILGRSEPSQGSAVLGSGMVVGELSQGRDRFSGDRTVVEVFQATTGLPVNEVRSLLAKFGVSGDQVKVPGRVLSPGERTRANLALFMAEGVNLLVLDEPTNHLDMVAIEQLEQALTNYRGTLLLVTHDRSFLERVEIDRRLMVRAGTVVEDLS